MKLELSISCPGFPLLVRKFVGSTECRPTGKGPVHALPIRCDSKQKVMKTTKLGLLELEPDLSFLCLLL
jgi:hypothetical protein